MVVLTSVRKSCFIGSMLGCAFGDVLGVPVEMQSRGEILQQYPGLLRDFQPSSRGLGLGCYSDDTEMTLALACSILRKKTVDGADCAATYARAFTPQRGYGRSAQQVLSALRNGADWRQTGTLLFAGGSFGNGAAMRIAPVGLLYGQQDYPALYAKVFAAVSMTHRHTEAIEVAVLQARAIGLLVAAQRLPEAEPFVDLLLGYAPESILTAKLHVLKELLRRQAGAAEVATTLGCGVRSADSWPAALWATLRFCADPQEAIVQAVNLGGDTDTIGAMTGALVGALHGDRWFPQRWFAALENRSGGRDELIAVAARLAAISVI